MTPDGGPPVHWLERVASTQDVAHRLASEGAADGTAVIAVEQTAGRGSRGREWVSPRGGLWLSVVLRPPASRLPETLSLRVALAAADALEAAGVAEIRIKWPNDLMAGERKLGGILCEARWSGDALGWVVVGIGLNVVNAIPANVAALATSLAACGCACGPGDLAEPMIAALRAAGGGAGALGAMELEAFRRRDWLSGRMLESPVRGLADGIAPDGALRVRDAAGAVVTARTAPAIVAAPREHLTPHR